ncbi:MAG: hypothetical protein ACTHM9_07735 [Gemmatimonadales bacterium]
MAITLPYHFDTSNIWRKILKGAFGLNAVLVLGILYTLLVTHEWGKALALVPFEVVVFGFTRVFIRFQEGSVGTLTADQVVVAPNVLLGIVLPGPSGTYALDRFSAVRVEFRSGLVSTTPNAGRPNEVVWLVGRPGTPNIALALTEFRAGAEIGQEFGALLTLPVEEVGAPKVITL